MPSTPTIDYFYDGAAFTFDGISHPRVVNQTGRRTGMVVSNSNAATWVYDTRGRVMTEERLFAGDAAAYTTSWTYNSADLPLSMTYPDGEVVTTAYDPGRMLLDTVTGTGTFGTANYVSDTSYDSAGRITDRALGNGLTQKFVYYPWNSKGGALNVIGAGSGTWDAGTLRFANSVLDLEYSYDNVGNITQIVNTNTATETQNYGYDSLNRLTSTTVTGGPTPYSESYTYDATTGNLASKGGVNYTYQPAHPHAATSAGGSYTYDADGNMITRTVGGQSYTFAYDAEGHLVTVSGGSYSAIFSYDGDGKRVKSTINSVNTFFVGNYYEKTGSTITKYYYAAGTRIGMRKYTIPQSMVVEYFLGDHLSSTSITTDTAGAKVSEMRYKPFGEVRYTWKDATLTQTTPAYALTKWTFTGQFSYADDPSTPAVEDFGLIYFNARFYDPWLGRFSSADTIVPGTGNPQAWDRYAFVNNNPLRYTDPGGHMPCEGLSGYQCRIRTQKRNMPTQPDWDAVASAGYSDWELSILERLFYFGGAQAKHGVMYIIRQGIHIAVETGWQSWGGTRGAWFESGKVVLNADLKDLDGSPVYSVNSMPDAWGLSLIIHEAKHLEQGTDSSHSKLGEMDAWQIQFDVLEHLGQPLTNSQREIRDAARLADYVDLIKEYYPGYWQYRGIGLYTYPDYPSICWSWSPCGTLPPWWLRLNIP